MKRAPRGLETRGPLRVVSRPGDSRKGFSVAAAGIQIPPRYAGSSPASIATVGDHLPLGGALRRPGDERTDPHTTQNIQRCSHGRSMFTPTRSRFRRVHQATFLWAITASIATAHPPERNPGRLAHEETVTPRLREDALPRITGTKHGPVLAGADAPRCAREHTSPIEQQGGVR